MADEFLQARALLLDRQSTLKALRLVREAERGIGKPTEGRRPPVRHPPARGRGRPAEATRAARPLRRAA